MSQSVLPFKNAGADLQLGCGRDLGADAGFFELCGDHELKCLAPSIEVADVVIVALHWAAGRAVKFVGAADE